MIKRIFKVLGIILSTTIILILIFISYSFINNKIALRKEKEILKNYNTGSIIQINNKKVNYKIFNENNTNNTIVFLGGSGATDLSLSLEPLSAKINAKIILINRPGYGNSSDTKENATIEYIINFYREVLKELKVSEQVILMPHSISGMYAIYWASLYPKEIKAIIGLDIGSPYLYLEQTKDYTLPFIYLAAKLGLHRQTWLLNLLNFKSAIINYDTYNEDYFKAIQILNNINPISHFNISEEQLIIKNAQKTIDNINNEYKNIPKLFIQANSISGYFYTKYIKEDLTAYYHNNKDKIENYKNYLTNYAKKEKNSLSLDNNTTFTTIEGPHCIYYYPSNELISTINKFLSK